MLIPLVARKTLLCNFLTPYLQYVYLRATINMFLYVYFAPAHTYLLDIDHAHPMYILQNGSQLVIDFRNSSSLNDSGLIPLPDDLIDRILIEIPASEFGQFSPPQNYHGIYHEDPLSCSISAIPRDVLLTTHCAPVVIYLNVFLPMSVSMVSHTTCAWDL